MTVRSVRDSNPGNLDAGEHWQGLMPRDQMTPEQAAETRFAVFASPKWGFRAMAVVLRNYASLYGIDTVQAMIERWAPPSENDTQAYIAHECQQMGVLPGDHIDLHDPKTLCAAIKGIAIHEAGGWLFSDADLAAGVAMVTT